MEKGNSINAISNAFVLSTFKGELFHLSTSFNPLHENVHIETSHNTQKSLIIKALTYKMLQI